MNNILTYDRIRVDCPYPIQYITELEITNQLNEHSRILVKGILLEDVCDKCITTSTANNPIYVYELDENGDNILLFSGVVTLLDVRHKFGVCYIEIEGMSYTYLLDTKLKSRSFQNKNALYTEVIDTIISSYKNADFILMPQDRSTGSLVVQYQETDWMFLRRLASHFNTVLIPDTLGDGPRFCLGIRQSTPNELEYIGNFSTKNDVKSYRLVSSHGFNVSDWDFTKYEVESKTRLKLGDRVVFQGEPCIVEQSLASFEDGLFHYKYVFGSEEGIIQPKQQNEQLCGLSLLGRVLDTQNTFVKIHLRIDENQNAQKACWIPYAAQSNNVFYSMPEKGENISLYFQNSEESSSIAVNAVRRNGGNCSKTSKPNIKYMGIPSGQEFKLGETDIDFVEKVGQSITLDDGRGISVRSPENMNIFAKQKLIFEAQNIFKIGSNSGNIIVSAGQSADRSQLYLEGGAGGNANIFAGSNILNDGRFKEVFEDRLNEEIAYEEKHFNFWEALLYVVVAVAFVALVVFTAGTALVAVGALAACALPAFVGTAAGLAACFAISTMVDDYCNDTTSSFLDYLKSAAEGAMIGACIACPILGLSVMGGHVLNQMMTDPDGPILGLWHAMQGIGNGIIGFGQAWMEEGTNLKNWVLHGEKFNPSRLIKLTGTTVAMLYNIFRAKDPVDVVTGTMFFRSTDFELPGPIPFSWSRTWYSDSRLVGQLGHSMRHCFEMGLDVYEEERALVVYLGDGRQVQFPYLLVGEEYFSYSDKMLLRREANHYALFDPKTLQTSRLEPIPGGFICYKLTEISNEQGHHIQFSYDDWGFLSGIVDSVGRRMSVITNETGQVTKVLLGQTPLIQYRYNQDLDLTEATDAMSQTVKMTYNNHLIVRKTDKNGNSFQWKYEYSAPGARVIETFGEEGTLRGKFVYHDEEMYTEMIDCLGNTEYHYDERNLCAKIIYPDFTQTRRVYDERFDLVNEIDEDGFLTTRTYNDWSQPLSVTWPDGAKVLYEYDGEGRLTKITNPEGARRQWIYSEDGTIQQSVNEMDVPTSYTYNENKLVKTVTNAKGDTIRLAYDIDQNLSQVTLPDGVSSYWEYDSRGNCLSVTNPLGAVQKYQYDALNRLVQAKLPDGNEVELEYNAYKDVIRAKDNHTEAHFEYTVLGSLKTRKQGNKTVRFTYDTEERLTSVINEKGEIYQFERDVKGNITKEIGFDKVTRTYERDQAGVLKKINRPEERFTAYQHDRAGRVIRIDYSDKTWDKFAYNKNGELLEAVNRDVAVKFERNAAGQVVKEWQDDHWVASEYDDFGRRTKISSSLGANILIERDPMGRMAHAVAAQDRQPAWAAKMQYNELGQEIERMLPGDVIGKWQYDATGRATNHLVRSGERDTRRQTYEWGINNQLRAMTNEMTHAQTTYAYDEFSNLVWSRDEKTWKFLYRSVDEVGNIYETKDNSDRIYGAGSRLERAHVDTKELRNAFQGGKGKLVTKGTEFTYDAEGNLSRKVEPNGDIWQYEYFGNGMLSKVVRPDENEVAFKYDSLGRRVEKKTPEKTKKTKKFVWDGNNPLHEFEDSDIITWVFNDGFIPTAKLTESGNYSIVSDYLGTPVEAYNAEGECIWSAELNIYGRVKEFTGEVDFIPFRYQGQYADVETGLYYNRFRYYDPVNGQYTQPDPIRLVGGNLMLYSYVFNPISFVDAFGLSIFDILAGTPGLPDVLSRGGCEIIAQQVQAEIGGQFLNITPNTNLIPEAQFLGEVTYSQGTITGWTGHVAVVKDGMVFDAMTGPEGMPIEDYQNMFKYRDVLGFEESNEINIGCG